MLNVEAEINQRYPDFFQKKSTRLIAKPMLATLRLLFHERELRQFGETYAHLTGIEFIEQVFEHFSFSYSVRPNEIERIPAKGKAVIIANHPIGTLDGMALLKMVSKVRPDVKVVANDMLMIIKPVRDYLLPVDNMNGGTASDRLQAIKTHLKDEGVIIMFPAGEVSRISPQGVKDGKWRNGFLRIASSVQAPIIPIYVNAKNSLFFYSLSMLSKPISTLWLIREMFKHAHNSVSIRIGEQINYQTYQSLDLPINTKTALFRKHLYRLTKDKPSIFNTQSAIAHPENKALLREEIRACQKISESRDGKQVYCYRHQANSTIMREIGRLREESFRLVGEGTGERRDVDIYDNSYIHILLWDDKELELIGAYRLLETNKVDFVNVQQQLYSATLFDYHAAMTPYLAGGIELGRSFIQPKYWGTRSLEYLWQGIMEYIIQHSSCRYLFGTVSISNSYSQPAKELLVYYYQHFYGNNNNVASATMPFRLAEEANTRLTDLFADVDAEEGMLILKAQLNHMGFSVPTLFKQYTKLCKPGGVQIFDFNIDPNFNHCIDGLIVLDLAQFTDKNKKRFNSQALKLEQP
ncbi:lysophospholipid acyltransferase family protein [Moritella sp. 24]|uniref:GNAT family N-acyltransferase n=1 Tax=Moritella sp. 24 TaxID=2746230 RepID=UPI001BA58668|nr:GNAT family N-acyltransferase [Moritella sp. 24]QUM75208.1 lysophospholipid acyltransferase family protein [Moritella sp. 24]